MAKPFIFTLMPFNEQFNDIYQLGIKETCHAFDTYCERVDEQVFQGSIVDRIFNQISKADIIIADMSGQNPNVFFEVGYAIALNKKIILLTNDANDIPFDLKHYAHIVYNHSIQKLKEMLQKQVRYYLDSPEKSIAEMRFGLSLYIDGNQLIENTTTNISISASKNRIYLSIRNDSSETFYNNEIKIGIIGDNAVWEDDNFRTVVMPDNNTMYITECHSTVFPEAIETFEIYTPYHSANDKDIFFKIFTLKTLHLNYTMEI